MNPHRIAFSTAVLFSLLPICAGAQPEPVYRVELAAGKLGSAAVEPAPHVVPTDPASLPQKPPPEPAQLFRKIHPRLLEWLGKMEPTTLVRVVIAFEDSVTIPRFPTLDPRFPREDQRNAPVLAAAGALVRKLKEERVPIYDRQRQEVSAFDASVTGTFWLIDAVVAEMPLGKVTALAELPDVLSIAPVDPNAPPSPAPRPAQDLSGLVCPDPKEQKPDTNDFNDVDDGRARIASDSYFALSDGYIGLLDSGVRSTHSLLSSTIGFRRDCVNGDDLCLDIGTSNTDDDCMNHGTSAAAILTGNGRAGAPFRGVTRIMLDSFKVYPSLFVEGSCSCQTLFVNTEAAVHAFQAAVADPVLDQVIVAEIEVGGVAREGPSRWPPTRLSTPGRWWWPPTATSVLTPARSPSLPAPPGCSEWETST